MTQKLESPVESPMILGCEDVTVNVLDDNDHNCEIDALDRVNEDEQEHTRNVAYEGSEVGDDAEYTHNNAAEYGIGHIEDTHKQYIDHTDNKAVEYLACDKLTEGLVYLTGAVDNLCSDLRLEQAVEDFFELSGEKLLTVEEVDGDNEAEQEVHEHADYVHNVGRDQIPYIVHLREKLG